MISRYRRLSGNTLKIIAIVTMIIDHIGAAILGKMLSFGVIDREYREIFQVINSILRNVGRTAFPIYCFLLVEGFLHTSSKEKYALRLCIFALVSDLPFNLAIYGKMSSGLKNVFFTLLIGMLMMWAMEEVRTFIKQHFGDKLIAVYAAWGIIIMACGALAFSLRTDYSYKGIILIAILYIFQQNRGLAALIGYLSFWWEAYCFPAFILMMFYNGKRKNKEKESTLTKYLFYLIYPVHLIVLYFIWVVISRS